MKQTGLKYFGIMILSLAAVVLQSCGRDLTYEGQNYLVDPDGDGLDSVYDNCPNVANPFQEDSDDNGIGDACEDNSSSNNASPVLYSMNLIDSGSCTRKLIWQDLSTQEVQVQILKSYKRIEYTPPHPVHGGGGTDITEYDDTLNVPIVSAMNTGLIEYSDPGLESWMKALKYQIKVTLQDGTVLLSNEMSTSLACE